MLLPWDRSLRVDLGGGRTGVRKSGGVVKVVAGAHYLSVKEMFTDHDRIDRRGIFKGQEGEAARSTTCVAHDRASLDLPKLGEVVPQSL